MNRDVFLSLLALDSYNRGYGQGLVLYDGDSTLGQNEVDRQLGTANLVRQSNVVAGSTAVSAGYYSIAYEWGDETIVSYRGTDFYGAVNPFQSPAFLDIWNGWGLGAGFTDSAQAGLAISFYESVLSAQAGIPLDVFDINEANITLVGHSLGGGLAGTVSALSGKPALLFDHMPFGVATEAMAFAEATRRAMDYFGLGGGDPATIFNQLVDGTHPAVQSGQLTQTMFAYRVDEELAAIPYSPGRPLAYHVEGELLTEVRSGNVQIFAGLFLEAAQTALLQFELPGSPFLKLVELGVQTAEFESLVFNTQVSDRDIELGDFPTQNIAVHSMALMTILLFAEKQWGGSSLGWQSTLKRIMPTLFDDAFAQNAFGLEAGVEGAAAASAKLLTKIAYTVLDGGEMPFGDAAVRALLGDADDLGAALAGLPAFLSDESKDAIGSVIAEFAGLLAQERITTEDWSQALDGILNLTDSLTIDLTDTSWSLDGALISPHRIIAGINLAQTIVEDSMRSQSTAPDVEFLISNLKEWLLQQAPTLPNGQPSPFATAFEDVDGISFSLTPGTFFKTPGSGLGGRSLIIGTDGSDAVLLDQEDSPAIIIGGGGENTIHGANGDDALIGGADTDYLFGEGGNDWFSPGAGTNYIDGGDGFDTVVYSSNGTVTFNYDGTGPVGEFSAAGTGFSGDTLLNVERVLVGAQTTILKLKGTLLAGTSFMLEATGASGQVQGINGRELDHGLDIELNRGGGISTITNTTTGGIIGLVNFNTEIVATEFDDVIFDGSDQEKQIWALAGDDEVSVEGTTANAVLIGGTGADYIVGGDGDDQLFGNDDVLPDDDGDADILIGGAGKDRFHVGDQDIIVDPDGGDRIYFLGNLLHGGSAEAGGASYRDSTFDITYQFSELGGVAGLLVEYTGGGAAGASFFIENFQNGDAGIYLRGSSNGPDPEQYRSPLVLDLNGDGQFISPLSSQHAFFDFAGDGFRELTAWVGPEDGLLALDWNGNGAIDDASELFGANPTDFEERSPNGGIYKLSLLDTNQDGIISALDTNFLALQVWLDANSDGRTDPGELVSLGDLGIVSIDLDYRSVSDQLVDGFITERASFAYSNGSTGSVVDAWFRTEPRASVGDDAIAIDTDILALPFLSGSGRVVDLHTAMQNDAKLQELVEALVSLQPGNFDQFIGLVEQTVLRWTGSDQINASSRGTYIDARHLSAVENWSSDDFIQRLGSGTSSSPFPQSAAAINLEFQRLVARTATVLLAQLSVAETLLPSLDYQLDAFLTLPSSFDPGEFVANAVTNSPSASIDRWRYWKGIVTVAESLANDAGIDRETLISQIDTALLGVDSAMSYDALRRLVIGGDGGDSLVGTSNELFFEIGATGPTDWTLPDLGGVDWFLGGSGDDLITTGYGEDTILFGIGSGHDTVVDRANYNGAGISDAKEIVQLISGLSLADVSLSNVSIDGQNYFRIEIGATGDRIDFYLSSGSDSRRAVEQITVRSADGSSAVIDTGTGAIETITAASSIADLIFDLPNPWDPPVLTVRALDGTELTQVTNYFISSVDQVAFNLDTTPVLLSEIDAEVVARQTSTGDDVILGSVRSDIISGLAGNDQIYGDRGDDRIDGGQGNDILKGGRGIDTYVFGIGSGVDTIIDPFGKNIVEFGPGITNLEFSYGASSRDLVVRITGQPDQLVIKDQFGDPNAGIETFRFADGSTMSRADVAALLPDRGIDFATVLVEGTSGRDTLSGTGAFTIAVGEDGRDTYQFSRGDGILWISDADNDSQTWDAERPDILEFGEGITPDDLIFRHFATPVTGLGAVDAQANRNHLEISIAGTSDAVRISSIGTWYNNVQTEEVLELLSVDTIRFADGTEWGAADILAHVQSDTSGAQIRAYLEGAVLTGNETDQTFLLDWAQLHDASVRFGPDSGHDTIYSIGGSNIVDGVRVLHDHKILLDESITPGQLTVEIIKTDIASTSWVRYGLKLGIAGSDATLSILDVADPLGFTVVFDDGTTLDYAELSQLATDAWLQDATRHDLEVEVSSSSGQPIDPLVLGIFEGMGKKFVSSYDWNAEREIIIDVPAGKTIADVSFRVSAAGSDEATEWSGSEFLVVSLGNGDELWLRNANWNQSVVTVRDSTGADIDLPGIRDLLSNGGLNDGTGQTVIFANRAENDSFILGSDDVLEFGYGDGQDQFTGYGKVRLKSGVDASDLRISLGEFDGKMTIQLVGSEDELYLSAYAPSLFEFADGSSLTYAQVRELGVSQSITSGDDHIALNFVTQDPINAGLGDDTIYTLGEVDYFVGEGNDTVDASRINLKNVSSLSDFTVSISYLPEDGTYYHAVGYIDEYLAWDPVYKLTFKASGETLSILDGYGGPQVELADGTLLSRSDLDAKFLADAITNRDDEITVRAWSSGQIVDARGGNDLIDGRLAGVTYLFGFGDGVDTILEANTREDQYTDVLRFRADVAPADVTVSVTRAGEIVFALDGSDDRIILPSHVNRMFRSGIERVEFEDGTVWMMSDVLDDLGIATAGDDVIFEISDGIERYDAPRLSGLFDGGAGNDFLAGGAGSDFYVFGRGYGQDTILDASAMGLDLDYYGIEDGSYPVPTRETDVLTLNPDVALADLEFLRGGVSGNDLIIRISGTNDQLTIIDQFDPFNISGITPTISFDEKLPTIDIDGDGKVEAGELQFSLARFMAYSPNGIEAIRLSNGVEISRDQIEAAITGTDNSGDNIYHANESGGTLDGGEGNDQLFGSSSDDDFIFARGYGEDEITDLGGYDVVNFGEGVRQEWAHFSRTGADGLDLLVEIDGPERLTLTINGQFAQAPGVVEEFTFLTGQSLTWLDVQAIILDHSRTSGDDTINGFITSDIIRGGAGHDTLMGLEGDDLLLGEQGRDVAVFRGAASEYSITYFADHVVVADSVAGRDGTDTLYGIEELVFGQADEEVSLLPDPGAPNPATLEFSVDEDTTLVLQSTDLLAAIDGAQGGPFRIVAVKDATTGDVWQSLDGSYRFEPSDDFAGNASFEVIFENSEGTRGTGSVTVTVNPVQDAPRLGAPMAAIEIDEDSSLDWQIPTGAFVDVDGDQLVYAATLIGGDPLPSWLEVIDDRLVGTPPADFNGELVLTITASDGLESVSQDVTVAINPVNDAPVVATGLSDIEAVAGTSFAWSLPAGTFTDVDGDYLAINVTLAGGEALPTWLQFENGVLSGNLPSSFAGSLELRVTASDGEAFVSDTFTLDITGSGSNSPPMVASPLADLHIARGETLNIAIPLATFADPDGDTLSLIVEMADGSTLPSWLSFDGAALTGLVPTDGFGAIDLVVRASDGSGTTADDEFSLFIGNLTGIEITAAQWDLVTSGNDHIVGRGAANTVVYALEGDDLITTDNWNVNVYAGSGDDIIEVLGDNNTIHTEAGSDIVVFDETSFMFGTKVENWATVTDFTIGEDRIALVNGTGGVSTFNELATHMSQNGSDTVISFAGLPAITLANVAMTSLTAADFIFSNWETSDGFGPAPEPGVVPYPTTTVTRDLGDWQNVGNDAERLLSNGSANFEAFTMDGSDHITSTDWNVSIFAGRGNDVIEIMAANTYVAGGPGYDFYVFDGAFVEFDPWDLIWATLGDYHDGVDKIVIAQGTAGVYSFEDLAPLLVQDGQHAIIEFDGLPSITIEYTDVADLDASHFIFLPPPTELVARSANAPLWISSTTNLTSVDGVGYSGVWLQGSRNADSLDFSSVTISGITHIDAGAGDDSITGTAGNDRIAGGEGDDLVVGGLGADIAVFAGDYSTYSLVTGSGSLSVVDGDTQADGDDGTDTLQSVETAEFKGGYQVGIASPIILDIDGDGIDTRSARQSRAAFDLNGDGRADDTSWIGNGDAFLFLDRNGDGTMSGVEEISFIDDVAGAASDLAGLAAFDTNGNGELDAGDERFGDFGTWRDTNGNGQVDPGETSSLADAAIRSIGLAGTAVQAEFQLGDVAILNRGSFSLVDGSTRELADAALTYFAADSSGRAFAPGPGIGRRSRHLEWLASEAICEDWGFSPWSFRLPTMPQTFAMREYIDGRIADGAEGMIAMPWFEDRLLNRIGAHSAGLSMTGGVGSTSMHFDAMVAGTQGIVPTVGSLARERPDVPGTLSSPILVGEIANFAHGFGPGLGWTYETAMQPSGTTERLGDLFDLLRNPASDANPGWLFDLFELQSSSPPKKASRPLPEFPDCVLPKEQSVAHNQDLPLVAMSKDVLGQDIGAGDFQRDDSAADVAAASVAQLLARVRQDMGAFGAERGEALHSIRGQERSLYEIYS